MIVSLNYNHHIVIGRAFCGGVVPYYREMFEGYMSLDKFDHNTSIRIKML